MAFREKFAEVAPLIRKMMERRGLNAAQVAREIVVSPMNVSYWLRGGRAQPWYAAKVQEAAKRLLPSGRKGRVRK